MANTPFDRLYFYGDDRPIHVSVGPQNTRQIVWMRPGKGGRRVPTIVETENFLRLAPANLSEGET